jgi:hypothetical protein
MAISLWPNVWSLHDIERTVSHCSMGGHASIGGHYVVAILWVAISWLLSHSCFTLSVSRAGNKTDSERSAVNAQKLFGVSLLRLLLRLEIILALLSASVICFLKLIKSGLFFCVG